MADLEAVRAQVSKVDVGEWFAPALTRNAAQLAIGQTQLLLGLVRQTST